MKRRSFVKILAGIVAIPAGIKALFDKQGEPYPTVSSDFEKDVNGMWEKHYKHWESFNKYWVLGKNREEFIKIR